MTIESEERTLERQRLMKQLDARAWDNVPDTRDDVPAEAIIGTMGIGLTSANMPIPEMLGDGWQSIFHHGDIHEDIRTDGLAVPSTLETTIQQITMPNTMSYLFWSCITENTIPNEIPTQTRRSRATQLRWQLTTAIWLLNRALPIDVPYEAIWDYSPAEQRLLKEGDVHSGIATPIASNCSPGSAGTMHRKIHSPIGNARSGKCTWTWID